mmetsp:Transcript_17956/g.58630  ORF Transcript_17956/g.58630 Transcript_17956/m.58630 type:complete len:234 (+) Transcript_17956:492-1193(+)
MIKKRSRAEILRRCASGSHDTPTVCASASPSERVMARPGPRPRCTSPPCTKTRSGPSRSESSYCCCAMTPPSASIRRRSSTSSGLCSRVTGTASSTSPSPPSPVLAARARTARESPMLARKTSPEGSSCANTAVVPLYSEVTAPITSVCKAEHARETAREEILAAGRAPPRKTRSARLSAASSAAALPWLPCPSHTTAKTRAPDGSCVTTAASWHSLGTSVPPSVSKPGDTKS